MSNTREVHLRIEGMSCGHCVHAVTKALEAQPGVSRPKVEIGAATVQADLDVTTPEAIARAVEDAGYEARVA
jgi:copper chaperone CopZ